MRLFVLLSHGLLEEQRREALEKLGVEEIILLPPELQRLWSSIPPQLESLKEFLKPIFQWLSKAEEGDFLLVQGDFGAVFLLVDYAFKKGLIPIYATTERIHREEREGSGVRMVKLFRHVRFRRYERWEGY